MQSRDIISCIFLCKIEDQFPYESKLSLKLLRTQIKKKMLSKKMVKLTKILYYYGIW